MWGTLVPVSPRIELELGDITECSLQAIVNAANPSLLGGGGVDGAIHRRGGPRILAACRDIRLTRFPDGLPTGQAVATTGGALAASWVIHTVGPVWTPTEDRTPQLVSAYRESLRVADEVGAETVAFPALSAGAYGWPMDHAAEVAISTVLGSGPTHVHLVRFVLFTPTAMAAFEAALAAR
jgi:O-acetyl-ADP-ribose deacetylase (regulator of RNase III)